MNCHPCDRNRPTENGSSGWIRASWNPPISPFALCRRLLAFANCCCTERTRKGQRHAAWFIPSIGIGSLCWHELSRHSQTGQGDRRQQHRGSVPPGISPRGGDNPRGGYCGPPRRRRKARGLTKRRPSYSLIVSKSGSPLTTNAARLSTAAAMYLSSSGSSLTPRTSYSPALN